MRSWSRQRRATVRTRRDCRCRRRLPHVGSCTAASWSSGAGLLVIVHEISLPARGCPRNPVVPRLCGSQARCADRGLSGQARLVLRQRAGLERRHADAARQHRPQQAVRRTARPARHPRPVRDPLSAGDGAVAAAGGGRRSRAASATKRSSSRCTATAATGGVTPNLRPIAWLPKHGGGNVSATAVNGVADQLAKVSRDLDAAAGGDDHATWFRCPASTIAGRSPGPTGCRCMPSARRSTSTRSSGDYWQWSKPLAGELVWQQPDPARDRRDFRAPRFYLGWPMVSFRQPAFRISSRADRPRQAGPASRLICQIAARGMGRRDERDEDADESRLDDRPDR